MTKLKRKKLEYPMEAQRARSSPPMSLHYLVDGVLIAHPVRLYPRSSNKRTISNQTIDNWCSEVLFFGLWTSAQYPGSLHVQWCVRQVGAGSSESPFSRLVRYAKGDS